MSRGRPPPGFSVIVASRGRPRWLARTLRAVRQLDYPAFEVIVVGDPASGDVVARSGGGGVRFVPFDEANLSAARNIGIASSAGEACAFIDDDAVPEPMWLAHHAAALAETGAAASVGFVRGPDGVRFQSRLHSVDREAETHDERTDGESPAVPRLAAGRAVKLVGTNAAVLRETFARIGLFDPAYRYFLEDSDLSMRIAGAGLDIAVAPLAEVHHAMAESSRRTRLRAARTLYDQGRSTAVFLRRHPGADAAEILERTLARERARLVRAMVRGLLEPGEPGRVLDTLIDGWDEGRRAALPAIPALPVAATGFAPLACAGGGHRVLASRLAGRASAVREAEAMLAGDARRASVFSFSLTAWPLRVRYTDGGVWLHTGGQFRRPASRGGGFGWCSFARRVSAEIARVAKRRGLDDAGQGLSARDDTLSDGR